jgi:hypothetical protein
VLTFTLDTSVVIAGVRREPEAVHVDQLIQFERAGKIKIAMTSGFDADQIRASVEQQQRIREYLSHVHNLVQTPGPLRLDFPQFLDSNNVWGSDEAAEWDKQIIDIVLAGRKAEQVAMKRMHDVHHLTAHRMAGHDIFVTKDDDDMLKAGKRDRLRSEVGIEVVTAREAVDRACS